MRGHRFHRLLHPVAVVERDFQIEVGQIQHRLHGAVGNGQDRQAGVERRTAQFPDAGVGLEAAGDQHAGDVGAPHRRHADRQQQIVAVAGNDHHRAGPQLLATVDQGGSAQRDVGDAPVQLPLVDDLRADHLHDIPHPRGDQLALPGNAAQQLEGFRPVAGALGPEFGLVAGVVAVLGAAEVEADMAGLIHRRVQQVDDAAEHPLVADAAVSAGDDFHGIGHLARGVAAGRGDDDDLGVQALRHLGVEMGAVGLLLGVHQALDDDDVGVVGRLLVAGDDLLQQDVFPVVAQQIFRFGHRDRFGRIQAGDDPRQPGRALRAGVGGVRLADRLAETHRNTFAVERVHQPEGDGGQSDPLFGGDDKNGGGHDRSSWAINVAMQYSIQQFDHSRVQKARDSRGSCAF